MNDNSDLVVLHTDTVVRLRQAIMAGHPNGRQLVTLRRIEASIDRLAEAMDAAVRADEPAVLDEYLNLVLSAQRRALQIPEDKDAAARFQELAAAWQANTMPDDQRRVYERNMIAANIRFKLRTMHPELTRTTLPLDPDEVDNEEARLFQAMDELVGPLRQAQAHTVPGTITPEWLDILEFELSRHRALLDTAAPGNKYRPYLCYTIASAAYALGRGRNEMSQPREARDAYAEAARFYTESGEPEDAASATEQAAWLTFTLTADIDNGTFDDLRSVAHGKIADPLDRAYALNRLARRASEANDQVGAFRYANATAAALADANFPDPESATIADVMAAWTTQAIARRTGQAVPKLLRKIGEMALGILLTRHAYRLRTDPALAALTEQTIAQMNAALLQITMQPAAVAAEIHHGLLPYIPNFRNDDPPTDLNYERALALWPRINAITTAVNAEEDPSQNIVAEARAVVAEAAIIGQPGLTGIACLARARLLARQGDLDGSATAAEAGETALLSKDSRPETLTNPSLFGTFLMLRQHRLDLAVKAKDLGRVLDLAEGAVEAIEGARYRISDPYQQGAYLTERTRFYEMAAFAAFRLQRWDNLIAVMDLFRSRSALRNRLAPPPEDSVTELAKSVSDATRAIEATPKDPALRAHRRMLWSLLSIARLRGAAGQTLPELTVTAVQNALASDEAVLSWVWVGTGVLIILALDKTRVQAERIILTDEQSLRLERYVTTVRSGKMPIKSLGRTVEMLTDALFPSASSSVCRRGRSADPVAAQELAFAAIPCCAD